MLRLHRSVECNYPYRVELAEWISYAARIKLAFEQRQVFKNAAGVVLGTDDFGLAEEYEGRLATPREG